MHPSGGGWVREEEGGGVRRDGRSGGWRIFGRRRLWNSWRQMEAVGFERTISAEGVGGLSSPGGGGGGRYSPLAGPPAPPKRAQLMGPQNPTETDPRASEVTRRKILQKKKMKMGFLESARRGGPEKSSFARYLVKKIEYFQCSKTFSVPLAPKFIITINGPVN